MPLLQVIYETIQGLTSFKILPSPLSQFVFQVVSFVEVFVRLFFRLVLIPYIFELVILLYLFFHIFKTVNQISAIIMKPLEFKLKNNHANEHEPMDKPPSMFSPPTSVLNVFTKTWVISDYCYDRFVLHAPLCLYNLFNGNPVHKYQYRARGILSRNYREEIYAKEVKSNSTNIDYLKSLRTFNLNSGAPSPIRSSNMSVVPLTPKDLLTEDSQNASIVPSPPPVSKSPFKALFTQQTQPDDELKDQTFSKPMLSKPIVNITPQKASTIRIKFNRRHGSSGTSFIKLSKRKRSDKNSDVESIESDTMGSNTVFNYEAVKDRIRSHMNSAPKDFDDGSFGPIFVRLAWHTSATYDQETGTGGSNGGTMRFPPELTDSSNTGLHTALLEMESIKQSFPWISYGDLWTLGGVTALEEMGCYAIAWKPGRIDCVDTTRVPPNGRLPLGYLGVDHIKQIFTRQLGFDARETVLLIGGGHSLGRCHTKYSGWEGKWSENPTHFSNRFFTALLSEKWDFYKVPSTGREQYVNENRELMMLNTDMELLRCDEFKEWVEYYARDNEIFLKDFAEVFGKLIELGVPR